MHQDLGKERFHFISKLHNIVRSSPQASDYRDLAFYSEANQDWLVEAGRFIVLLGSSSRDIRLEAEFDYSE